jgi:hypothetical protein
MDTSRFDLLSKQLAAAGTRREALQALAALSLGGTALALGESEAKPARGRSGVEAQHLRRRKRWYCLNGKSMRRYRRKQEKLLAQGATLGKCKACTAGQGQCNGGCCNNGVCAPGTATNACGAGGEACTACVAGESCVGGECVVTTCGARTCPNGCCDGNTCLEGTGDEACGTGGEACHACAAGQVCQQQVCVTHCTPDGQPCDPFNPGACCSQACRNEAGGPVCFSFQ